MSASYSGLYVSPNDGRVGIGHSNPQHALDVTGDVSVSGTLRIGDAPTAPFLLNTDSSAAYYADGYVGIGLSNPSFPLHVSGSVAADAVYDSGSRVLTNTSNSVSSANVASLDAAKITAGTLPVARGGTGATTSTGSGSVVLSVSPALTGIATAATLNATTLQQGGVAVLTNASNAVSSANIASLDASKITTGTLQVSQGGTGVTTSTGSGNNVLSVSPTFTGTVTAATLNATALQQGGVAVLTNGTGTVSNTNIAAVDASKVSTGILAVANGGTGVTTSTGSGSNVLSAGPTFTGTVTAATINATALQQGGVAVLTNGTGTVSNTNIAAVDASKITTGTLAVARGGTGVTTSTGTGNLVLSADPTFTGTITAATINATALNQGGYAALLNSNNAVINTNILSLDAAKITTGTLAVARGGTGVTTSTGTGNLVLSAGPTFTGTVTAATISATSLQQGAYGVLLNSNNAVVDANIAAVDAAKITTGTLAVVRGGTGVTTATGTGNNVLSASPTLTGTVTAATLNATTLQQGGVGVLTNGTGTVSDANIAALSASKVTGTLAVANGGTGTSTSTGTGNNVLSASPTLTGTVTAATLNATTLQQGGVSVLLSGTGTVSDTNIASVSASKLTGSVPVANGGTGTTTSTGTGSLVLSAGPTFTGTLTAATINATTLQQGGVGVLTSGTGTVSDTNIAGVSASKISGTLAVANGGTGVTTSTGTGNNVLSADPTFTGTVTAATLNATTLKQGNVAVLTNGTGTVSDTNIAGVSASKISGTLAVANGGTGVTTSTGTGSVVLSAAPTLTGRTTVGSLQSGPVAGTQTLFAGNYVGDYIGYFFNNGGGTTPMGLCVNASYNATTKIITGYKHLWGETFNHYGDGNTKTVGTFTNGGADYAEYFEWADGNPNNEDRTGMTVVLITDGSNAGKVRPANLEDDLATILGVVSACPSVIGNDAWSMWSSRFIKDEYGRTLKESAEHVSWLDPATHQMVHHFVDQLPAGLTVPADAERTLQSREVINPAYDPSQPYVPRAERKEWVAVGVLGKLRIRKPAPKRTGIWTKIRDVSADVEEWWVK